MKGYGVLYLFKLKKWKKLRQKLSVDEKEKKSKKKNSGMGNLCPIFFINLRTIHFLWIQKQQKPLVEGTYANFFNVGWYHTELPSESCFYVFRLLSLRAKMYLYDKI